MGYLPDTRAVEVADFLDRVFNDIDAVRGTWPATHEESITKTKGAVSFSFKLGEVKTEVPDVIFNISLADHLSEDESDVLLPVR